MLFEEDKYHFMMAALKEAEKAFEMGEVPIGAVVVYENKVIGKGFNQTESLNDATAHAEMLAITAASNYLQSKVLDTCDIYITVEPCVMCAGAILLSKIKNVYFGTYEPKFGAVGSIYSLLENNKYNHKINVYSGIHAEESKSLMNAFFSKLRIKE